MKMEGRLSLEDFPSICRICLTGSDLKSFYEKKYLTDLFTSITDIQIEPQDDFPKNICQKCMSKIEDISGFIDMSKSNNIGFLQDLVKEEVEECHSQLETEIIVIDDGTSIKIEQPVREKCTDIFPYVCRICVEKKNLGAFSESKHLVDVFMNITNLAVSFEDCLPKNVCRDCIQKLQNISDLIELSKSNNTKLENFLSSQQNGLSLKKSNEMTSMNIHNEIKSGLDGITVETKSEESDFINKELEEVIDETRELDSDNQDSVDASKNSDDLEDPLNMYREGDNCHNSKRRLIIHLKREQIGNNGLRIGRCQIGDEDFSSLSKMTLMEARSVNKQKEHHLKTARVVLMREKWISDRASLIVEEQSEAQTELKILNKTSRGNNASKTSLTQPSLTQPSFIHSEPSLQCTNCLEKFSNQNQLTVHMKIHADAQPYRCKMCAKTYKHKKNLMKHSISHRGLKPFEYHTCSVCLNSYPTKDRLTSHMKIHSTEKKFNCSVCPKAFILESYLRRHLKMHTPKDLIECHLCSKSFGRGIYIRRHLKTHTVRERMFECAVCSKSFCSKQLLALHLQIHRVERSFKCSVCSAGFPLEKYLKTHMMRCYLEREKSYQCTFCPKKFYHPSDLRNHQRIHEGVKRVKCKFCTMHFFHESKMLIHLRVHTGEKPYPCTLCSKRFSCKTSLTNHLNIHAGERPFECTECSKRFNKKASLKAHMNLHTGERPYQCKICSKRFAHYNNLHSHGRVHSDIKKPHKCNVCSRGFSGRTQLKIHMRIHTGEKPFKCTICPSTFAHELTLQRHLSRHRGEKPYTCDVCSKGFVIKPDLAIHFNSQHRHFEFHCDICSKSFDKIGNLKKHISRAEHKNYPNKN